MPSDLVWLFTWAFPKGSPSLKLPFVFVVFCVQSQIAVWAFKRMRADLLCYENKHTHGKYGGFISSVALERKHEYYGFFYDQTTYKLNAHSVCGRPTENVLEHFMKGSFRGLYERSIYERTFLSEPIENHDMSNALSKVKRVKKHLSKHYRVFRRDRELRFHHVDFLVYKTGYSTKEAQVHADRYASCFKIKRH